MIDMERVFILAEETSRELADKEESEGEGAAVIYVMYRAAKAMLEFYPEVKREVDEMFSLVTMPSNVM